MPSQMNTKLVGLVIGAAALSAGAMQTIQTIRDNGLNPNPAIFTEDVHLITADNATPSIRLDQQTALTFQADGDVEFGSGDIVGNMDRNAAFCNETKDAQDGGRKYGCIQQAKFTNTGACVAGGCATKAYAVAAITKPYSGTGVLNLVDISCDGQPVATNIWVAQVAAATTSGSNILASTAIGSGTIIRRGNTGSTIQWRRDTPIINVVAGARVGNSQCLLTVRSDEAYNP